MSYKIYRVICTLCVFNSALFFAYPDATFGQSLTISPRLLSLMVDKYPTITLELVSPKTDGRRVDDTGHSEYFNVNECGMHCSITSFQYSDVPISYSLDILIDPSIVKVEYLRTIQSIIEPQLGLKTLGLQPHSYIYDNNSFTEHTFADINRLAALGNTQLRKMLISDYEQFCFHLAKSKSSDYHIILLIVPSIHQNDLSKLSDKLLNSEPRSIHWVGVLQLDQNTINTTTEASKEYLFLENLNQPLDSLQKRIGTAFQSIANGHIILSFNSPNIGMLSIKRFYTISVNGPRAQFIKEQTLTVSVPDSLVKKSFIEWNIKHAGQYLANKQFIDALDSLYNANKLFTSAEFTAMADTIIQQYGEWIIKQHEHSLSEGLFSRAEEHWHCTPGNEEWYKVLKYRLLNEQYMSISQSKETLDQRAKIKYRMVELYTNSIDDRIDYDNLLGESLYEKHEYWKSVDYLAKSYALRKNSKILTSLHNSLRTAFIQDNEDKNLTATYQGGKAHLQFFTDDFELRYLFAKACLSQRDFNYALDQFKWMILNWDNTQKYLRWQDAFDQLQQLYSATFQFWDAFRLNQRIYRQQGVDATLVDAVKDLRAQYYMGIISMLSTYGQRIVNSTSTSDLFDKKPLTVWPHDLHAIYTISKRGVLEQVLGNKKMVKLPQVSNIESAIAYPVIVEDTTRSKIVWLVNRLGDKYVIIQFTKELNLEEHSIIADIRQSKMSDAPWEKLVDYERIDGVRALADMLSGILAAEMKINGNANLQSYWDALSSSHLLVYMVFHGMKGEIKQNIFFTDSLYIAEQGALKKSSNAKAFLKQSVDYDKRNIIDIADPIYFNNKWHGVVRMGFRKM